jgi:hypothetical protein
MLSLELAIQKIQQFPAAQRNQVIQFVEFLDFTSSQATTTPQTDPAQSDPDDAFFALAGMWATKDITAESLRRY